MVTMPNDIISLLNGFTPSKYQLAVFEWILNGQGHGVINAVPGSGKSTTLLQGSKLLRTRNAKFLAFNRSIMLELKTKLKNAGSFMTAETINGFGFGALRRAFGEEKFKSEDDRRSRSAAKRGVQANKYTSLVTDYLNSKSAYEYELAKIVKQLVSLVRMTMTPFTEEDIWGLVEHYDIDLNRVYEKATWDLVWQGIPQIIGRGIQQVFMGQFDPEDLRKSEEKLLDVIQPVVDATIHGRPVNPNDLQQAILATSDRPGLIDFDEQVWLPVTWNLDPEQQDWLFVDECQDLNKARLALILRGINKTGRILFVGDPFQSIYGFSGADTDSMNNIVRTTHATVMPLSICYRCPSSHIELCASIFPGLEAAPDAPKGRIEHIMGDQLEKYIREGDLVLCRTKAPLVSTCLSLIRSGIRAKVRGTDIGASFVSTIEKLNKRHAGRITVENFPEVIETYRFEQAKLIGVGDDSEMKLAELDDKVNTMSALHAGYCDVTEEKQRSLPAFLQYIQDFFSDERGNMVVLSTVHKAKGLEEKRVFILRSDLMPHPKAKLGWQMDQELNIKYVAFSRSKYEKNDSESGVLFFVNEMAQAVQVSEAPTVEEEEAIAEVVARPTIIEEVPAEPETKLLPPPAPAIEVEAEVETPAVPVIAAEIDPTLAETLNRREGVVLARLDENILHVAPVPAPAIMQPQPAPTDAPRKPAKEKTEPSRTYNIEKKDNVHKDVMLERALLEAFDALPSEKKNILSEYINELIHLDQENGFEVARMVKARKPAYTPKSPRKPKNTPDPDDDGGNGGGAPAPIESAPEPSELAGQVVHLADYRQHRIIDTLRDYARELADEARERQKEEEAPAPVYNVEGVFEFMALQQQVEAMPAEAAQPPLLSAHTHDHAPDIVRVFFQCQNFIGGGKKCLYRWGRDYYRDPETGSLYRIEGDKRIALEEDYRVCPACAQARPHLTKHYVKVKTLKATYHEGTRCSASCQNATSEDCECVCGGKNHGKNKMIGTPLFKGVGPHPALETTTRKSTKNTTYIVFLNRKKGDGSLNDFYKEITLGTIAAPNTSVALKQGAQLFNVEQHKIDVVAESRADFLWKKYLKNHPVRHIEL